MSSSLEKCNIRIEGNAYMPGSFAPDSVTPTPYTPSIVEGLSQAEILDRYDDYASLRINTDEYQKRGSVLYGIPYQQSIHGHGSVIREEQRRAGLAFLKELRGFGLLADTVGSGKTFEACLVLSELAVRNQLKSLLLVVPDQVCEDWIRTLEIYFGMGQGVLLRLGKDGLHDLETDAVSGHEEYKRIKRPILVSLEDFSQWNNEDLQGYLFDAVVVDEAHHLNDQSGANAKAMKLLSEIMQIKRAVGTGSEFCLLLSATPHSGNLEQMFPLWYFIDQKGGLPSDFDEKADSERSELYRKTKEAYLENACHGAKTVMGFVRKVKLLQCEIRPEFRKYCDSRKVSQEAYRALNESRKIELAKEFLDIEENAAIREEVERAIASAYHNGILRRIMIRQPSSDKLGKKKKMVQNYLFFPTKKNVTELVLPNASGDGKALTVYPEAIMTDKAIRDAKGRYYSLREYIDLSSDADRGKNNQYGLLMQQVIEQLYEQNEQQNVRSFQKKLSDRTYKKFVKRSTTSDNRTLVLPAKASLEIAASGEGSSAGEDTRKYLAFSPEESFRHKFQKTLEILEELDREKDENGNRVLIFFDYDRSDEEDNVIERFVSEMKKSPYADRLIEGSGSSQKAFAEVIERFTSSENGILVVMNAALTEGANLQSCNTIINFQVTSDPLAMDQRIGRIFRIGQKAPKVNIFSLADMNELEGYMLMYFSFIGLMNSNTGDATIISGSNSERMVTLRCHQCNHVELISLEEYAELVNNEGGMFCDREKICRQGEGGRTEMHEINAYDFKCDSCGVVFSRSLSGKDRNSYICIAETTGTRGIMCSTGDPADRRVYCRKICAVAHCEDMRSDCAAVALYKKDPNVGDSELMACCLRCSHARDGSCPERCRIGTGPEAIMKCATCRSATCSPKPYVLDFQQGWVAKCPVCATERRRGKTGMIRPIVARTFAAYVRSAWDHTQKGDSSPFCNRLESEADSVFEITTILGMDNDDR